MYFFDIKKLENITTEYFNLIEDYFGAFYTPGLNKYLEAQKFKMLETAIQAILVSIEDLEEDLQEFWQKNSTEVISIIENTDIFKVLYSGDMSPLDGINFIKKTALYLDTLLIEDPISRLLDTKIVFTDKEYLFELTKHIFNLLDMKKLFFGEGSIPLLVIFPPLINKEIAVQIRHEVKNSSANYFSSLLQRDFKDYADVWDYLKSIKSSEQLINDIKDTRLLFLNEDNILERLNKLQIRTKKTTKLDTTSLTMGEILGLEIYGRFSAIGTQVFQSQYLSSQIVFDYKELWDLYKWDINQTVQVTPNVDNTMLHALQTQEFRWLENIDIDKFYLLRNEDEIKMVREALRRNIYHTLNGVSENHVKKQASINLDDILNEHSRKLEGLSKDLKKKFSIDTLAFIGGVISSVPAHLGIVPVIGAVSTIYGAVDIFTSTTKLVKEKKRINKSLMGVLIDAKQRSI